MGVRACTRAQLHRVYFVGTRAHEQDGEGQQHTALPQHPQCRARGAKKSCKGVPCVQSLLVSVGPCDGISHPLELFGQADATGKGHGHVAGHAVVPLAWLKHTQGGTTAPGGRRSWVTGWGTPSLPKETWSELGRCCSTVHGDFSRSGRGPATALQPHPHPHGLSSPQFRSCPVRSLANVLFGSLAGTPPALPPSPFLNCATGAPGLPLFHNSVSGSTQGTSSGPAGDQLSPIVPRAFRWPLVGSPPLGVRTKVKPKEERVCG